MTSLYSDSDATPSLGGATATYRHRQKPLRQRAGKNIRRYPRTPEAFDSHNSLSEANFYRLPYASCLSSDYGRPLKYGKSSELNKHVKQQQ